jgi:putative DNA methylase
MFTHRRVEAWDTLASALIEAGFEITASWPVHTEFEHSMHIANKNAAESTILLVCRKRTSSQGAWWDEILPVMRQRILERAKAFEAKGFRKLDLMLATYGPALQVLSEHWPVREVSGALVQPEQALSEARRLVTQLRVTDLVQHRQVDFDPLTRWYVLAWDVFGAEKFPYDEARLLALTCGVELDRHVVRDVGLASKSGKYIVLRNPVDRLQGLRRDDLERTPHTLIEALQVALAIQAHDGAGASGRYLTQHGLTTDPQFQALVDACLAAFPAPRPERKVLQALAVAHFKETSRVLQMTLDELEGRESGEVS